MKNKSLRVKSASVRLNYLQFELISTSHPNRRIFLIKYFPETIFCRYDLNTKSWHLSGIIPKVRQNQHRSKRKMDLTKFTCLDEEIIEELGGNLPYCVHIFMDDKSIAKHNVKQCIIQGMFNRQMLHRRHTKCFCLKKKLL